MRSREVLRQARTIKGLSQRQLASEAGVAQSAIARYESGRVEPSLEQLRRLLARAGLGLRISVEPVGRPRHELHAVRSRSYHQIVAERLRSDPELLPRAIERVRAWQSGERAFAGSREYIKAWSDLLSKPLPTLIAKIVADDEEARELRQNSPFSGMLGQAVWEHIVANSKDEHAVIRAR